MLEDVTPFPIVAANLGIEGAEAVDYTLTNSSTDTPTAGDLGAAFEKPIHNYDAVEFTLDRRFANNWGVQASYRWSRLRGTFEGFYRDDNGQSDPGITSLFDFPTNDPSYTAIGVPQFGFRGDIRFLGKLGEGPLPLDRPHQVKVYGNYAFNFGLNAGARPADVVRQTADAAGRQSEHQLPERRRDSRVRARLRHRDDRRLQDSERRS